MRGYRNPKKGEYGFEYLSRMKCAMSTNALEHLNWMQVRNYSTAFIHGRMKDLAYFVAWCMEHGLSEPTEVTKPIIERYQNYLYHYRQKKNGQPLSTVSQIHRLSAVRAFFKWMTKQNYLLYNPASEIELPRLQHRLPKVILTAAEADQVLNQANVHDPLGVRDRAILEVFYSTGMRRMEIVNLKFFNVDFDRGTIMIRQGKGKKDRVIPVGDRALKWVEKYLLEVRPSLVRMPDDGTLFLTAEGEYFCKDRVTSMVGDYVEKANIGKKGACHMFRHTCATLMLEGGADIRFIQQMLGHAALSTTEIYTQVSIRKLKEIHTATHPAKLNKEPQNPSL
jgi:integrase/recombinase XerD